MYQNRRVCQEGLTSRHCSAVLSQRAVSAYFTSKQILPFGFAECRSDMPINTCTVPSAIIPRQPTQKLSTSGERSSACLSNSCLQAMRGWGTLRGQPLLAFCPATGHKHRAWPTNWYVGLTLAALDFLLLACPSGDRDCKLSQGVGCNTDHPGLTTIHVLPTISVVASCKETVIN